MEQAQALRICSGAFKTSPVAAMRVEIREMPLRVRRVKHWVNLQGRSGSHPTKAMLEDCWELNETHFRSVGWVGDVKARNAGLHNIVQSNSPYLIYSALAICATISRSKYKGQIKTET